MLNVLAPEKKTVHEMFIGPFNSSFGNPNNKKEWRDVHRFSPTHKAKTLNKPSFIIEFVFFFKLQLRVRASARKLTNHAQLNTN